MVGATGLFLPLLGAIVGGFVERLIEFATEVVDHGRISSERGAGEQSGRGNADGQSTEVPFEIDHEWSPWFARGSGGAAVSCPHALAGIQACIYSNGKRENRSF